MRSSADLRGTERAGANDDHLARLDDGLLDLPAVGAVARGNVRNTDGLVVPVEEDAGHTGVAAQEQVVLHVHNAVHVSCTARSARGQQRRAMKLTSRGITATAGMAVDVLRPDLSTVTRLQVCKARSGGLRSSQRLGTRYTLDIVCATVTQFLAFPCSATKDSPL